MPKVTHRFDVRCFARRDDEEPAAVVGFGRSEDARECQGLVLRGGHYARVEVQRVVRAADVCGVSVTYVPSPATGPG